MVLFFFWPHSQHTKVPRLGTMQATRELPICGFLKRLNTIRGHTSGKELYNLYCFSIESWKSNLRHQKDWPKHSLKKKKQKKTQIIKLKWFPDGSKWVKMIYLPGKVCFHSPNNLTEIWNAGTNYKYGSRRPMQSSCIFGKDS